MRFCAMVFCAALLLSSSVKASSGFITKELMEFQGRKRAYYLFVPKNINAPAPMIVTLHGSGRNGNSLVEKWKSLAEKEGIILVGPDSLDSSHWSTANDSPDFLYDLVEAVKSKHPVNARRVYLFGHSAGAVFALYMSLYESQYFAATAIHAGSMSANTYPIIDYAKRKTPISIFIGTRDSFFPLDEVRATRDALNGKGFSVELTEIANHNHWYYDIAPKINRSAWEFLKKHELSEDPKFERYSFNK